MNGGTALDLLRLPDEVLEEVSIVLVQDKGLGLVDDFPEIQDQPSTLGGQADGRVGQGARGHEAVQRNVDLLVLFQGNQICAACASWGERTHRWDLAILESGGNAVDLELAIDIGVPVPDVGRPVDLRRGHDCNDGNGYQKRTRKKMGCCLRANGGSFF